jgi:hypothetical protein
MGHQKNTHTMPAMPVAMNADCHPYWANKIGTRAGAMIAPMFEPELKMPVANARSLRGYHSATVLIAAGKLPDSPNPSANRAIAKPTTLSAKACAAAASDHRISDTA